MNDLAQGMNFQYKIRGTTDNKKWGHVSADGKTSSGLVRDVLVSFELYFLESCKNLLFQMEATDIGFQNFIILPARFKWIGYLAPFNMERICFLAPTPPEDAKYYQYFKTFTPGQ